MTNALAYYNNTAVKVLWLKQGPHRLRLRLVINDKMKVETFLRLYFVVLKPIDD